MAVDPQSQFFTAIIALVVAGLFVHWSAKIVLDRSRITQAILAAFLGIVLANLIQLGVDGLGWPAVVDLILALAGFSLVTALVYRTDWAKGAVIGVVAWILYAVVRFLVDQVMSRV